MDEHVIAERVRSAREWRGWSQQELARRAALHPVVLNRLEKKHKAGVQAETIRRLAVALQVSADYLLGITTDTLPAPAHNADSTDNMEKYRAMTQASIEAAMGLSWDVKRQTSHVPASPEQAVEPQREQRRQPIQEQKPPTTRQRQTVQGMPAADGSPVPQGKVCLRGHAYDGVLCPDCEALRQQHQKPQARPTKRQRPRKAAPVA